MAELSPAQLDRLEDALERLEHEGTLEQLLGDDPDGVASADPVVAERFDDYRQIIALSREAMPIEEVPDGLLDDVLAQAKAAAAAPAAVAARESWWKRWSTSLFVPAVALAGTAALVLWIGQPDDVSVGEAEPANTPVAAADDMAEEEQAQREQAPAAAAKPAALERGAVEKKDAEGGEAPADEAPPPQAATPVPADPEPSAGAVVNEDPAPEADEVLQTYGRPGAAPAVPAANDDAKGGSSGRWDLVSRADAARQAGDCVSARSDYAIALEDDLAQVRARATAGIGLCDALDGNQASADANYDRARELDSEISAFIDSQIQPSKPRPKKRRSKKSMPKSSGKKSKAEPKMLDQLDPFDPL